MLSRETVTETAQRSRWAFFIPVHPQKLGVKVWIRCGRMGLVVVAAGIFCIAEKIGVNTGDSVDCCRGVGTIAPVAIGQVAKWRGRYGGVRLRQSNSTRRRG